MVSLRLGGKMSKQNKVYLVIVVVLLSLSFTGCATIFNGRTQRIRIDSNVRGATVKIDGIPVGQTPFLGDMPRSKKSRTITVETRGFEAQSQTMTSRLDGTKTVLENSIIPAGAIGFGFTVCSSWEEEEDYYYDPYYGSHSSSSGGLSDEDQMIAMFSILGGLSTLGISSTVDHSTGSAYQYSPSQFYFHFSDEYGSNTHEILLRKYAMLNHSQIAIDAQEESGEYLNALADMMSKKMPREEAIKNIRVALDYSEGDQLAFGNEIVDSFRYYH